MNFEIEQKNSYTLDEVQGFISKFVQSETDKVRTEYSRKIKELQAKLPAEPTEAEKALMAVSYTHLNLKRNKVP